MSSVSLDSQDLRSFDADILCRFFGNYLDSWEIRSLLVIQDGWGWWIDMMEAVRERGGLISEKYLEGQASEEITDHTVWLRNPLF